MAKKIVVFADGTGNTVDRHDSNVLRLCRMLDLSEARDQVAIYDPGVGTTASIGRLRAVLGWSSRLRLIENQAARHRLVQYARLPFELGLGVGTDENIRQLYRALIEEYQPGAEIYLFGFSRGAFTVRALAGLLHRCGLLKECDEHLTDCAMKLYRRHYEACRNDRQLRALKSEVERFKRDRSHLCDVRFLGIWDTVKAVGYLWPTNLPHIRHNPIVQSVRHAVSLSERRTFYVPTTWGGLDGDMRPAIHVPAHLAAESGGSMPPIGWQDVQEVWFAGDHSDVGGGRPVGKRALADVSLHWMINEAHEHGLRVCPDKYQELATAVAVADSLSPAQVHDELKDRLVCALGWWVAECAPRRDIVNEPPPPKRPPRVFWPAGRRKLAPAARSGVVLVHCSARNCYETAPPWNGVQVRFVKTTERVLPDSAGS